jgi:threonine/homoserine/homoserine lactone efflux protein
VGAVHRRRFAALVAASEIAYGVLRIVGAVVLLALGARALRAAGRLPAFSCRA